MNRTSLPYEAESFTILQHPELRSSIRARDLRALLNHEESMDIQADDVRQVIDHICGVAYGVFRRSTSQAETLTDDLRRRLHRFLS